jgi:tetratricopeptide (TPR) repeat protein
MDQRGGTQGVADPLPPEIQLRLDSANAAYRARDYDQALELFTRVAEMAPDLAAGWYGMGMTHGAMGNQAEADSAMMQAHRLAPEIPLDHPGPAPQNPHPINPHQMQPDGGDPHPSPPRGSRGYEGDDGSGA